MRTVLEGPRNASRSLYRSRPNNTISGVQALEWWYAGGNGFLFGALTASFLCVVGERVPKGLGIGGRSHCACGRQLRWRENIPVIGWLRCRGIASCCGASIPRFYLMAELALGAAWAGTFMLTRVHVVFGVVCTLVAAVVCVLVAKRALN